jgi:hypothetical protein
VLEAQSGTWYFLALDKYLNSYLKINSTFKVAGGQYAGQE